MDWPRWGGACRKERKRGVEEDAGERGKGEEAGERKELMGGELHEEEKAQERGHTVYVYGGMSGVKGQVRSREEGASR